MTTAPDVPVVSAAPDVPTVTRREHTWRDYALLSLYWLPVNIFWTAMMPTLLPGRVEAMVGDASKGTYLAYITALGAIATTIVQLVVAPLSDSCASRMGRRHPFILVGTVAAAVFILMFGIVGNFPLLALAFFGIQLCMNTASGPYQALLPDNVPASRHGLASAYMGIMLLVGQLLGAVSVALVNPLHLLSITGLLAVLVVLLLIGAGITVALVPDRPAPPEERQTFGEAMRDLFDWQIRENPDFYGLLQSRFAINLAYSTVVTFLFYYLQDAIGPKDKAPQNQVAVLLTVTLAGLVGTLVAGRFSDRMSKKTLVYITCALMGIATILFCLTSSFPLVLAMAFVFGAGLGAFAAVDWALACNLLPKGGAAKFMAIWHICFTIPQIIAPTFGVVADVINHQYGHGLGWRAAFLSTVFYLIAGAALLRRVKERPLEEVTAGSGHIG